MRFLHVKKVSVALAVVLGGGMISDAWADAATPTDSNVDKQVELLSQQTAALQQQLQQLQQQIAELKSAKATPVAATASETTPAVKPAVNTTKPAATTPTPAPATTPNLSALPYGGRGDLANIGGTAVITAPFIRSNRQFSGSDLIVNYSTIKKNVAILQQNKNFVDEMQSLGIPLPNFPLLELSGNVEGDAQHIDQFNGKDTTDINLSNAELDMQARVSPWVTGFMSFVYDSGLSGGGRRVDNSNVYLDNGFITVGNFEKSHYYGTIGQLYVPFGSFSTYAISDPFNKILFRTKGRPIVLGYNSTKATGLDTSIYGYKGDARTGDREDTTDPTTLDEEVDKSSLLNEFGADAVYHFLIGGTNVGIGGSVINNVSDSGGMQFTGYDDDRFEGFGESSNSEIIKHNVPGADLRFDISNDPIELIGEYASATESFSSQDLTFNGHGARPSATHVESDYSFSMFSKPSTFTLAYDQSNQALALNVPRRGYTVAVSTSIFKNTLETLELHHYVNYSSNDTASGDEGVIFGPEGHTSDGILAHIDAYF